VQEKVGSMEKDEYEMVISQMQGKAGSMEKAEYEMMFQLFMSMTFRLDLLPKKLSSMKVFSMKEHIKSFKEQMKSLYLMCFLTRDEGELRKCNDFMVTFVYTTATTTESRANETGIVLTSGHKAHILGCCQEIMAYDSNLETQKNWSIQKNGVEIVVGAMTRSQWRG
jgi:hypothetical protein